VKDLIRTPPSRVSKCGIPIGNDDHLILMTCNETTYVANAVRLLFDLCILVQMEGTSL
jgi:hypothetical protein